MSFVRLPLQAAIRASLLLLCAVRAQTPQTASEQAWVQLPD